MIYKYQKHTAYYYFYFTEDPDSEFTLLKSILLPKADKETTCRPLLKGCTFWFCFLIRSNSLH